MNSRSFLHMVLSLAVLAGVVLLLLAGCAGSKEDGVNADYEDMKAAFSQSGLLSANIGFFPKQKKTAVFPTGTAAAGSSSGKTAERITR